MDILGNPRNVHRAGEIWGRDEIEVKICSWGHSLLDNFQAPIGVLARDWVQFSAIVFCALSATENTSRCVVIS